MDNTKRFGRLLFVALLLVKCVLPSSAQNERIRFAFMTDTHYSISSTSIQDLRNCINDINSQDDIDFTIVGGDLTDFGTDEELNAVKEDLDRLKVKYYVVAGNHDAKWSESGCNTFKQVFGYENFEFNFNGWRFIGCNCGPDMRMAPALIPAESINWLKGLEAGKKTIFINHYPQDTSVLNYFDVTRELKRIGTQFAIGGHWHSNVTLNYDGLPAVLCRSTLSAGKCAGYSIVTIENGNVSIAEKRVYDHSSVLLPDWYTHSLAPVKDTVTYDSHGLPTSYPWMRYDVNDDHVKALWTIKDKGNVVSGFARNEKYAWYASASGTVNCISLKNGRKIWSKTFGGKIFSTPTLEGNSLVFGCTDKYVYCVNAKNGKLNWKRPTNKSVLGSPVIYKGKVFIGESGGAFYAFDLKSGLLAWENRDVEGFVECKPYVDDEQVVFGTWSNKLYSLNTNDGSLQWTWEINGSRMYSPAAVWPVKSQGKIFIAVPNRKLYVLDASNGKEITHFDSVARESVGISDDGKTVYCKSMWHTLTAIDVASLKVLWQVETGTGYDISPTSISTLPHTGVLMPTDKGNIVCFKDGKRDWAYKISIALVNPMEVWTKKNSEYVLASTMDGTITLLLTK